VSTENFTTRYQVEVERNQDSSASHIELEEEVSHQLKTRLGVKPKTVVVLEPGDLPRATHKAKRLIDLRSSDGNTLTQIQATNPSLEKTGRK
jgi:phenylacetate-CoA ligase